MYSQTSLFILGHNKYFLSAEILNIVPQMGDVKIEYFYTFVLYSMYAFSNFNYLQLFVKQFKRIQYLIVFSKYSTYKPIV